MILQVRSTIIKNVRRVCAGYRPSMPADVLAVCVLDGGVMFFSDVVRELGIRDLMFIKADSYGHSRKSSGVVKILYESDVDVVGRNILLIDDICDTGLTLSELKSHYIKEGAASVTTMVYVTVGEQKHSADYSACRSSAKGFLYGYGMDLNGRCRGIQEIRECTQ